ncbi:TetR family transcriptional regulator [Actinokineospora bangkokensis]|uniref:TetR family transcriptional regulator n=1 Tax=Actinokineospora bangkokensis TaxID=1193682 RepID=A0A1Q9LMW6_9PSEU|nr:TetR/AcrR family transcriptional regulator [Actinokineospora bangkokensis]OLR93387.1 TetR family transcriptional regulator [Actinokineospora bangkokensis]
MADRLRADARRNHALILAVAEDEVARRGAEASLEQIARTAGVGSATVRRHFPTRHALLEAVSGKRIAALCARAADLAAHDDSRAALMEWLSEVVTYCVTARGLAVALAYRESDPLGDNTCAATLAQAGTPLLERAVADGGVAGGVSVLDLIALAVGVTLATEHGPDPLPRAHRLFEIAMAGVGGPAPV